MDRMRNEEVKTRNLKEKILAEVAEEEKCCLIIGFPFSSNNRSKVIDGLIVSVMKEGMCRDNEVSNGDLLDETTQRRQEITDPSVLGIED